MEGWRSGSSDKTVIWEAEGERRKKKHGKKGILPK